MKRKRAKQYNGYLYIIVATLGFSVIPILAEIGLSPDMTAGMILFYRFFFAGLVFLAYCLVTGKHIKLTNKKEYAVVLFAGVIYSVQCIFFFSSVNYISASLGEILYHCYPLFVLVLAYIFLKERVTKRKVCSVIVSIIGVGIVLYAPWALSEIRGIVYVIITAFVSSIYMIYTKKYLESINITVLTMYLCLICSVVYLMYVFVQGELAIPQSYSMIANILVLSLFATVIGFFFFMKAIAALPVSHVAILSLLEPVFTVVLAFAFLDNTLTPLQIIGTVLILAALYWFEE